LRRWLIEADMPPNGKPDPFNPGSGAMPLFLSLCHLIEEVLRAFSHLLHGQALRGVLRAPTVAITVFKVSMEVVPEHVGNRHFYLPRASRAFERLIHILNIEVKASGGAT
jgi:hypothetical protein